MGPRSLSCLFGVAAFACGDGVELRRSVPDLGSDVDRVALIVEQGDKLLYSTALVELPLFAPVPADVPDGASLTVIGYATDDLALSEPPDDIGSWAVGPAVEGGPELPRPLWLGAGTWSEQLGIDSIDPAASSRRWTAGWFDDCVRDPCLVSGLPSHGDAPVVLGVPKPDCKADALIALPNRAEAIVSCSGDLFAVNTEGIRPLNIQLPGRVPSGAVVTAAKDDELYFLASRSLVAVNLTEGSVDLLAELPTNATISTTREAIAASSEAPLRIVVAYHTTDVSGRVALFAGGELRTIYEREVPERVRASAAAMPDGRFVASFGYADVGTSAVPGEIVFVEGGVATVDPRFQAPQLVAWVPGVGLVLTTGPVRPEETGTYVYRAGDWVRIGRGGEIEVRQIVPYEVGYWYRDRRTPPIIGAWDPVRGECEGGSYAGVPAAREMARIGDDLLILDNASTLYLVRGDPIDVPLSCREYRRPGFIPER